VTVVFDPAAPRHVALDGHPASGMRGIVLIVGGAALAIVAVLLAGVALSTS
jgi:hypothetical protein